MPTLSGNISSSNTSLNGDVNNKETKWGLIGGTLSAQTDLQNALDDKQDEITSTNKLSASLVSGLSTVATSGSYNDLSNKPTIGDASINIKKNGSLVQAFTLNQENDQDINIIVPTKTSDITKDDVYTKTESNTLLNAKADKSTTYTKTETDTLLNAKQNTISDLSTIRSGASLGATSLQPNDNVSELVNDAGYLTSHQDISHLATKTELQEVENEIPTKTSDLTNDSGFITSASLSPYRTSANQDLIDNTKADKSTTYTKSETDTLLGGKEDADATILKEADVVNNTTSTSTNYPLSANMGKELQTEINNLKNIGRFLAIWNASTGSPTSEPTTSPYEYKVGDYYRIGVQGTKNPAPNLTYTTGQTNWVEGNQLNVGDVVYISNVSSTTTWVVQASSGGGTVQDVQINGTSILSGGVANIPIATDENLGLIKCAYGYNYGLYVTSAGVLYLAPKTYSQYLNQLTNNAFIGKGTLENVLDNESVRVDKAQSLTDAQKQQARSNIGASKDEGNYELIETITLTEDVNLVIRSQTPQGVTYNFKNILILFDSLSISTTGSTSNTWINLNSNNCDSSNFIIRGYNMPHSSYSSYAGFTFDLIGGRVFANYTASYQSFGNSRQLEFTAKQTGFITLDNINKIAINAPMGVGTTIKIYAR